MKNDGTLSVVVNGTQMANGINGDYANNAWNYIYISKQSSLWEISVNGLETTLTYNPTVFSVPDIIYLGNSQSLSNGFGGSLDEFKIWTCGNVSVETSGCPSW
jgi:hypothetical protein